MKTLMSPWLATWSVCAKRAAFLEAHPCLQSRSFNLQVIQAFPGQQPSTCGGRIDLWNSIAEDLKSEGKTIESHLKAHGSNLFF